jgi:hypothetical protein
MTPLPLDPFILGDNAFLGVNHRSRQEGDERARRFADPREVAQVCLLARKYGAGGLMLSSHARAGEFLNAIRAEPGLKDFRIYPNIPYIMKYVQKSTQSGVSGLLNEIFSAGSWHRQFATLARGGIAYLQKDFRSLLAAAVDLELAPYRRHPLPAVFLHNGLADLALGLGWTDVFRFWDELIRRKYRAEPGFGTANLPRMAEALARSGLKKPLIMAPFSAAGFHMNPSQADCEAAVQTGSFSLLAMNILASGSIAPEKAFEYVARFPTVKNFVVGATSEAHLAQNAALLKNYLVGVKIDQRK